MAKQNHSALRRSYVETSAWNLPQASRYLAGGNAYTLVTWLVSRSNNRVWISSNL
jgi:hypothetical protein